MKRGWKRSGLGCGGWILSKGTLGSNNGLGFEECGDDGGETNNSTGVSFGGRDGDGVLEG